MALAGYTGLLFSHQQGLVIQAGIITAIVAAVGLTGGSRPRESFAAFPRPVRVGLGLYAAVALWAAAVGVLSGNPPRYILGQLVAMLLLPVAALAFAMHGGFRGDILADALAIACLVALVIHATVPWLAPALVSPLDQFASMHLRYGTTFSSIGVLALACLAARLFRRRSWLGVLGFLAAGALVAGGLSRGAWISSSCGLVVVCLLLSRNIRSSLKWLAVSAVAFGLTVTAILLTAAGGARELARVDLGDEAPTASAQPDASSPSHSGARALILDAGPRGKGKMVLDALCDGVAGLEVSAWFRGPEGSSADLLVEACDANGKRVGRWQKSVLGTESWSRGLVAPAWPQSATRLKVAVWVAGGRWLADDVEVIAVQSSLSRLARRLVGRFSSLLEAARDPASDATVRYRINELHGVMARWSQAGVWRLVAGHGLGAQFPFVSVVWRDGGQPATAPIASYIHNLYVFFGFKLGLAGVAGLCGLLMIAGWTAANACDGASRCHGERWVLAAGTAAWVSCLVWGVTSPEIIDFRVAPLLGALVAATSRCITGSGAANEAPRGAGVDIDRGASPETSGGLNPGGS